MILHDSAAGILLQELRGFCLAMLLASQCGEVLHELHLGKELKQTKQMWLGPEEVWCSEDVRRMFGDRVISNSFRIHFKFIYEYLEDPQRGDQEMIGDVLKRKPLAMSDLLDPRHVPWQAPRHALRFHGWIQCISLTQLMPPDSPSGGNMEKQNKNHWNPANLEFYQLGVACSRKLMKKRVCRLCSIIPIAASWCLLSWRC